MYLSLHRSGVSIFCEIHVSWGHKIQDTLAHAHPLRLKHIILLSFEPSLTLSLSHSLTLFAPGVFGGRVAHHCALWARVSLRGGPKHPKCVCALSVSESKRNNVWESVRENEKREREERERKRKYIERDWKIERERKTECVWERFWEIEKEKPRESERRKKAKESRDEEKFYVFCLCFCYHSSFYANTNNCVRSFARRTPPVSRQALRGRTPSKAYIALITQNAHRCS